MLQGSEKQIAWANEIKTGWESIALIIKKAAETKADLSKKIVIYKDPLSGVEQTIERYLFETTAEQKSAISTAGINFLTKTERDDLVSLSGSYDDVRLRESERLLQLHKKITDALENELDCTYWIHRR